jgi:hypothetical protein
LQVQCQCPCDEQVRQLAQQLNAKAINRPFAAKQVSPTYVTFEQQLSIRFVTMLDILLVIK